MPLTLTYFPIRARAEPIRILLVDSGIDFEDKRIPYDEEWKTTLRAEYPFQQLPVLEIEDGGINLKLPETNALLQYVEENCCVLRVYREHDPINALKRAKVIAVKEACLMHIDHFWEFYWAENWTDIDALKRREAKSHAFLERLGKLLQNVPMGFLLGDPVDHGTTLTAGAAVLFEALELFDNQFPGALAEKHPELAAIHAKILSRPRIAEYLKSGKRPDLITLSSLETAEKRAAATETWKKAKSA